jgi:hypothetical protein
MKSKEIYPGLFLYIFENQFDMCSTFFRLQEFFESPIKQLRGKYFTYEKGIEYYAYNNKVEPLFSYFADWGGFNVPGKVVNKFKKVFKDDLTEKELALLNGIPTFPEKKADKYYLIGCEVGEEENLKHEVGHGLYYLNKKYRQDMNRLIKLLPERIKLRIREKLLAEGYCKLVIKDEIHAYLATGVIEGMLKWYDYILHGTLLKQFKNTFEKYYSELKIEQEVRNEETV